MISLLEYCKDKPKYNVVYIDPPWSFGSKQYQDGGRDLVNINEIYNTMSIQEIKDMGVDQIVADDSVCFMWVTDSHLKEGIEIMEHWGFKYKTIGFVWVKKYASGETCVNVAPYTLKSTEICILGTKGSVLKLKKSNKVRQLVEAERREHSRKPDEIRERIVELYGDVPKIEIFARTQYDGWDAYGNEVEKFSSNKDKGIF